MIYPIIDNEHIETVLSTRRYPAQQIVPVPIIQSQINTSSVVTNIRHRDTTVHCYAVSKADEQCHLAVLDTAGATYETKVPKNSRKKKKTSCPRAGGIYGRQHRTSDGNNTTTYKQSKTKSHGTGRQTEAQREIKKAKSTLQAAAAVCGIDVQYYCSIDTDRFYPRTLLLCLPSPSCFWQPSMSLQIDTWYRLCIT